MRRRDFLAATSAAAAEIARPIGERKLFTQQMMREEALMAFEKWKTSTKKVEY